MKEKLINPIVRTDCPDPDVIRVNDTYYMVNTTMYFMPGCEILRSYDLVHWEHASYVYETLDSTSAQRLEDDKNIYACGMWAASLRYHKGTFYICFVANDTHRTYLYTSNAIEGPWNKQVIEGEFFHDCSLLFDDDDRVYIAYGNREIYITELKADLSGVKPGGLHKLVVKDSDATSLGYEGTHFYKINGKYYLFFIHSLEERWFRTEACYVADSVDGEYVGRDILQDDRGYCDQGVAQGAIVDTPEGDWYAILFQDSGAVGRMPILMPMHWEDDFPVIGVDGRIPEEFDVPEEKPGYEYKSLIRSDDFKGDWQDCWQYNHEPRKELIEHDACAGEVNITTGKVSKSVVQAQNTLTQRMAYPACTGEISIDFSDVNEGDYAGLCVLQGAYGFIAVTKRDRKYYLVTRERKLDTSDEIETGLQELMECSKIRLKVDADFERMQDEARFSYTTDGKEWKPLGTPHKLGFRLDHFTGARFGLFIYSTIGEGGSAKFSDFTIR